MRETQFISVFFPADLKMLLPFDAVYRNLPLVKQQFIMFDDL